MSASTNAPEKPKRDDESPIDDSFFQVNTLYNLPYWLFFLVLFWLYTLYRIAISDEYTRIFEELVSGVSMTLGIAIGAYLFALVLGLLAGIVRAQPPEPPQSKEPPLKLLGRILYTLFYNLVTLYVETMRGIPPLVFLLITGFIIVPEIRDPVEALLNGTFVPFVNGTVYPLLESVTSNTYEPIEDIIWRGRAPATAIAGLAVIYGAFLSEVFRAGIQAVPKGQVEAAKSLGMTYVQTMRYVVVPQAVRNILPPLGNNFISMIKDTSLATVLGTNEITQLARKWSGSTFQYLETYMVLSLIYLTLTVSGSLLVQLMERRLQRHTRR